ncbi:MAG: DUF6273 domain-containing protein, partial [Oscillospiraceae bacterium]|nr:DUF6273 domain-containing protein [Oscillospiraceae bacterium]
MKTALKRTLSVLLTLLMAFSCAAVAFAEPEPETGSNEQVDFVSTTSALSSIVAAMSEEQAEASYAIADVTMDGKKATVKFNNATAATLVVSVYAENGGQMLGTGVTQVEANVGTAEVELNVTAMPDYFVTKAFLLDSDNAPLCKNYESKENTKAFEQFLQAEPEDFGDDTILVFDDEKAQEDFAVLTDDVMTAPTSSAMTYTFDEATDTFVFRNAVSAVKNLKVGEMFYYDAAGDDYLLFKVKSISVSGSTVTIVQDTDVGLDELFSFVRIDAEGDYDKMEPMKQEDLGEALLLNDDVQAQAEIDETGSNTWSTELKIKYPQKDLPEGEKPPVGSFTASGSLKLSIATSVSIYYDIELFGRDYYEFKHQFSFKASLSGTISAGFDLTPYLKITIPSIPIGATGLSLKIEPGLVFKGSVSVTFKLIEYSYKITTTADPDNGLHKAEEKNHDVDLDLNDKFEITFGVHLDIKLSWAKGVLSLKLAGQVGVKLSGSSLVVGSIVDAVFGDRIHDCGVCIDGDSKFYWDIGATFHFKFLGLKWDWDIAKYSQEKKLLDFYVSTPHGFGKGVCPHIYHAVNVQVNVLENGVPKALEGATVSAAGAQYDTDGDGKWDSVSSVTTGKDGKAKLYFKPGTYTIDISCDPYSPQTSTVKVLDIEKTITVTLGENDDPDTPGSDTDFDGDITDCNVGDIIQYGSYPQSRVTDTATLRLLEPKAQTGNWTAYPYYIEGTQTEYMYYLDVRLDTQIYRGVWFDRYRPAWTGTSDSESYSNQYDNGYRPGVVYWFRYEPLQWRVLNPYTGFVLCETIIDSQDFHHTTASHANGKYANNWGESDIRTFLNTTFMNTAFNGAEQQAILSTDLDTPCPTNSSCSAGKTTDKVFLLSYYDVINPAYGFADDAARRAKGSAYAKCQGLWVSTSISYRGNAYWRLRSPRANSYSTYYVRYGGSADDHFGTNYTSNGVRPALRLNLGSVTAQSEKGSVHSAGETGERRTVSAGQTYTASQSSVVPGEEYVLLVRAADADALTADTLWYIDQKTADSAEIGFAYVPSHSGECTVEIIGRRAAPVEPEPQSRLTGVTCSGGTLVYKKSMTLAPTVQTDGDVQYTLTYSSSNPKIAEVDRNG